MHIAVDKVGTGSITDGHHRKGCDKEEGDDAKRTIVEELHPQVADLDIGTLLCVHHYRFLTLREAEEKENKTHKASKGLKVILVLLVRKVTLVHKVLKLNKGT